MKDAFKLHYGMGLLGLVILWPVLDTVLDIYIYAVPLYIYICSTAAALLCIYNTQQIMKLFI